MKFSRLFWAIGLVTALAAPAAHALTVSLTTDKSTYRVGDMITYALNATLAGGGYSFLFGTSESLSGLNMILDTGLPGAASQTRTGQSSWTWSQVASQAGNFTSSVTGYTTATTQSYTPGSTTQTYTTQSICFFGSCTYFQVPGPIIYTPGGWTTATSTVFAYDNAAFSVTPVPIPASGLLLMSALGLIGAARTRKLATA